MITVLASEQGLVDRDGLPVPEMNEILFHAEFELLTEHSRIQGIVTAFSCQQAGSRLLAAEAQLRGVSYINLYRRSGFPRARIISREEALTMVVSPLPVVALLPKTPETERAAACVSEALLVA